jgi:hypothetical protein
MALKVTTQLNGVLVKDAYVRVNTATCNKTSLTFQVCFFADANENAPFKTVAYDGQHNLDGENAIKQAYEILKNLPDFANAQDC